ncbi:PTC1 Serine/threonine protein phosphatase [Candidatus Nanopelagicaceae bacterium]
MSTLYFATAAKSAVGLVRAGNEDSAMTSRNLIAVADGMGGHAAGEVASRIAITSLASEAEVFAKAGIDLDSADDLYASALSTIDSTISEYSIENPELAGMGTTLSSLFLRESAVAALHVGDSRIYRLRGNLLEQLTTDHTVIQELLSQGTITEADVATHPQRSVLTQVLIGDGRNQPALSIYEVKADDRFLLCSDGLTNVVGDKEIKAIIKGKARGAAVDALVDAAYINGAPDNVTVIVADVLNNDIQEPLTMLGAAK